MNTAKKSRCSGRPRNFDRDEGLAVALDLFWRDGYDATSTKRLTSALGITQTSLYAAYGSKEQLFREALELYRSRYTAFMTRHINDPALDARDAIESMLTAAAEQFSDVTHPPGCMIVLSGLQSSHCAEELLDEIAEMRRGARRLLRARLDKGHKNKELPDGADVGALAGFFAAVIQGMAVQARDGAKPAALKRIARIAMIAWPTTCQYR